MAHNIVINPIPVGLGYLLSNIGRGGGWVGYNPPLVSRDIMHIHVCFTCLSANFLIPLLIKNIFFCEGLELHIRKEHDSKERSKN